MTFTDIEDLPTSIQDQLFEEILDRDAQKQLEEVSPIINWSLEITERLGSRLYALWNRTAGFNYILFNRNFMFCVLNTYLKLNEVK